MTPPASPMWRRRPGIAANWSPTTPTRGRFLAWGHAPLRGSGRSSGTIRSLASDSPRYSGKRTPTSALRDSPPAPQCWGEQRVMGAGTGGGAVAALTCDCLTLYSMECIFPPGNVMWGEMWEIEATEEFRRWYARLSEDEAARVNRAVDELAARGPGLGRPWVDTIRGSRYPNMKELR